MNAREAYIAECNARLNDLNVSTNEPGSSTQRVSDDTQIPCKIEQQDLQDQSMLENKKLSELRIDRLNSWKTLVVETKKIRRKLVHLARHFANQIL